jgi:methionyl aminopeptidase
VKSEKDIAGMVASGRLAREVLDIAGASLKVGMTTNEIDAIVHAEVLKRGAYPSPLNYCGALRL